MRTGFRAALTAAFACLMLPAAQAGAVTPVVLIEDNNADLNTFQALNQTVTASKDKDGSNFIRFGENLLPPTLRGGEGKADTFAQQASTVVTPSVHAFPTSPIFGIGLSGRVRASATKANNTLPGVPVADSVGSMSADFNTNAPTPFQFSGAMVAANNDATGHRPHQDQDQLEATSGDVPLQDGRHCQEHPVRAGAWHSDAEVHLLPLAQDLQASEARQLHL